MSDSNSNKKSWRVLSPVPADAPEPICVHYVRGHALRIFGYRDAMPGSSAAEEFQLHVKLCAKCVPGMFRPKPVVVGEAGEVQQRSRTFKRSRW